MTSLRQRNSLLTYLRNYPRNWWSSFCRRATTNHEIYWKLEQAKRDAIKYGVACSVELDAHELIILQKRLRRYKISTNGPLLWERPPINPREILPAPAICYQWRR